MKRYLKGFRIEGYLPDTYREYFDFEDNKLVGEFVSYKCDKIRISSDIRFYEITLECIVTGTYYEIPFDPNERISVVRERLLEQIKLSPSYEQLVVKRKLYEFTRED